MGMLLWREYSSLKSSSLCLSLRNHAPLWLIWTSILLCFSLFLLSLLNLLAFSWLPYFVVPPGFRQSWWGVSVALLTDLALVALHLDVVVVVASRTLKNMKKREAKRRYLTDKKLWTMMIWRKRYVNFWSFYNLLSTDTHWLAYKLSTNCLRFSTSVFTTLLNKFPGDIYQNVYLLLSSHSEMASSPPLGKEKEKGKAPLVDTNSSTVYNAKNSINHKNSTLLPTLKSPLGGSSSKIRAKKGGCPTPKFDPTTMFNKLAAARENGKKKKELTLVGFLVGEPKEFPRIFTKLRMEWKPIKGTLSFSALKFGWFEVVFSNQTDFQLIWANRPYHLFSQLLLIKQWYPGFNPTSESISQLDLWVRLHYLPEEFANSDALETIIEGNFVGKFLRMDHSHNSDRWNLFTRFCINTDVERTLGKGVIVPDEHFNQIKFTLWFDDFSPGCGACGKISHVFRDCPSKNAPIPTLNFTIKKPLSKNPNSENPHPSPSENKGWNVVGKNNRIMNPTKMAIPNNNIYLSERGGISVTYESEDSEENLQHFLEPEEVTMDDINLISVAADLHPYNIMMKGKNDPAYGKINEKQFMANPEEEPITGLPLQTSFIESTRANKTTHTCNNAMSYGEVIHLAAMSTSKEVTNIATDYPIKDMNKEKVNHLKETELDEENTSFKQLKNGDPSALEILAKSKDKKILLSSPLASDNKEINQPHPLEEEMQEYDDE